MKFALLDPRNTPEACASNDAIFAAGPVMGIEVTIPALAARCTLGNIDPQHLGTRYPDRGQLFTAPTINLSAIDIAADISRLPSAITLATIRPDVDAVGGMAIISINSTMTDWPDPSWIDRAALISAADRFAQGPWQPATVPTRDNPWPTGAGGTTATPELAALSAMCEDRNATLDRRVEMMSDWLLTGILPGARSSEDDDSYGYTLYELEVYRDRTALIAAIEGGTIKVTSHRQFAVAESRHRAALQIGYSVAPLVVAYNPEFRWPSGDITSKFTIARWPGESDVSGMDWPGLIRALNVSEDQAYNLDESPLGHPGKWGGSSSIVGSPQGMASRLSLDQVVNIVAQSWESANA